MELVEPLQRPSSFQYDRSVNKGILPKLWVDEKTRTVRDEFGSHVILHGVNVVFKHYPYIPDMENFHP